MVRKMVKLLLSLCLLALVGYGLFHFTREKPLEVAVRPVTSRRRSTRSTPRHPRSACRAHLPRCIPDQVFAGRVRRVAPYVLDVEKQARTVDVEVEFIEPADCGCMLPGYSADIEVILAEQRDVLRIPTEAVREGNRVLVVADGDRLEERQIETGLATGPGPRYRSGLEVGDTAGADRGPTRASSRERWYGRKLIPPAMIELTDIDRHFQVGDQLVKALDDVSLHIGAG
jgi:hypothetical protein